MACDSPKTILFSPIGTTDPLRNGWEGACLHIIRHYHPDMVVLFYTKEMAALERKNHLYTQAIKRWAPYCHIEEIFTDIEDPHVYDRFIRILPEQIHRLHQTFPEATILLNITSGTPQIQTVMAILSMEGDWCKGIQVTSPEKGANRGIPYTTDTNNLEYNCDNLPGATDRCIEQPLRILRYFGDRTRIISLIEQYEYHSALNIAKKNSDIPEIIKQLLEHATKRSMLLPKEAAREISKYKGVTLFPFHDCDTQERLLEYALTMQIDQKTGRLSNMLIKSVPLLYELLKSYVFTNSKISLTTICEGEIYSKPRLTRNLLETHEPGLLRYLDSLFKKGQRYRDGELSYKVLANICGYMETAEGKEKCKDNELNTELTECLNIIKPAIEPRNDVAHIVINIDEKTFVKRTQISSMEMMDKIFDIICIVYADSSQIIRKQRNVYDSLNRWIIEAFKTSSMTN